jgi:hypothetical protein
MLKYVAELVVGWDKAAPTDDDGFMLVKCRKHNTAAPNDLFKVNGEQQNFQTAWQRHFTLLLQRHYLSK